MSTEIVKFPKIIILLLVCTFANFMGILFTPALPLLGADFGIEPKMATLTMSIFLVGYALGQLPYGPLANRFGRKKALSIGMMIALFGTLIALFSSSFWALCVGRFLQAIGSSAGLKVAFTMVGDVHQGEAATKAVAMFGFAFGLAPGLATAIGGVVTTLSGWKGCFFLLGAYTIVLWVLMQFLPETVREIQRDALELKKIGCGYFKQFKDTYILRHAFMAGLTTASIYIFVTLSPYIAKDVIGLSPAEFGFWAIVPSLGICTGSIIARKKSAVNPRVMILSGFLIFLVATAVISLCFANGIINVWTLFIPVYFLYIGNNLIWSNALSVGLSQSRDKSNASAVIQFINMSCAMVGVFLVDFFSPDARMLLPAAFGAILVLGLATWLWTRHRKNG
jgi:MFS family permease